MRRPMPARRELVPPPQRQRGLALVIVLWTLTLLAVIAAEFAYSTRIESQLARNVVDGARARQFAQAGIARAVYALTHPNQAERWRADGTIYRFSMGAARIDISVHDETGFIDLNAAQAELLDGMFRVAGVDEASRQTLVDAILDWRDPDSLRRVHGVEDDEYVRAGYAYRSKDAPFDATAELMLVAGMSPALYRRVEPLLTVHSGRSTINRDAAPRDVLLAIPGADRDAVEAQLAARGTDAGVGVSRQTGTYRIRALATLPTSEVNAMLTAVVRLGARRAQGPALAVLAWREG